MRIDAIVVPRGAEARAVERGWNRPQPPLLLVPAGAAAGSALVDGRSIQTALVLGLCGALDPALRVGEAVVYTQITDGTEALLLDPQLTSTCSAALGCTSVRATNVATVIGDVAAKSALRRATGASAIDMEAAAIARAFALRGVRVAMVRVVSDDAIGQLPDLRNVYDVRGRLRPFQLAYAFARTPWRGARFARNAIHALGALRTTAERLSAF